jgi:hypothetical protein
MNKILHKHKAFWSEKSLRASAIFSIALLIFSFLVNYLANIYTSLRVSNYVTDIILDNIPVFNVDFVFYEGFIIFWLLIILLLLYDPKKIAFVVKSIAVFILIRSAFITLTHIATPPNHSFLDPYNFFLSFTSGNDLFFSSHTGLPFLMALIFWNNKRLRLVFIFATFLFATTVLMGHLHYSIDVFAALFITYSIFDIVKKLFAKDYQLFLKSENT